MKMDKTIKLKIYWKFTISISCLLAVFLAVSLRFSYLYHKNFLLQKARVEVANDAYSAASIIMNGIISTKNNLSFFGSHNDRIRQAAAAANASYAGLSEQEIEGRLKGVAQDWDVGGWKQLKKSLTENEASFVLWDQKEMTNIPLEGLFITDKFGAVVATINKPESYFFSDKIWWRKTLNYGSGAAGIYFSDPGKGVFVRLFITAPIKDLAGRAIGVLNASVETDKFFTGVFVAGREDETPDVIMTEQGTLLFSRGLDAKRGKDISDALSDPIVKRKWKNEGVIHTVSGDYLFNALKLDFDPQQRLSVYVYSLYGFNTLYADLGKATFGLFSFWFIVATLLFWVVFLISKKIIAPIDEFRKGFDRLKKRAFNESIQVVSGDEFEELAKDFNNVVQELRNTTISTEYFSKIVRNISDILFVVNPFGAIDLVNKRACDVLGYSEDELKGKDAADIFAKKDRYIVSWGLKGLIEEGALKDKKIDLMTKSGKQIEVYLGTRSLRDAQNNLIGLVCLAKDLTEVNKLLDDLRRSTDETIKHKQELEKTLQELLEARDVMLSILEDTDESKKVLEETVRKLKETQDQLLQAEKMVSLGQIAAGVAHEINNPLFVISGEAEMLGMEEEMRPESVKDSVRTIREQVARIGEIIKRLLEFSRKKEVKFSPLDINVLLDKVLKLLAYQAKLMGQIEIVRQFVEGELIVEGDQNQLQEVFLNLMINAVQAMEERGGILTIRTFSEIIDYLPVTSDKIIKGDKVVCVQISDTGTGMTEETTKRIFDPFFTTKNTGTGLGLSVCLGIVENHNGIIDVDSRMGEGTTFTVKIPLNKKSKIDNEKKGLL